MSKKKSDEKVDEKVAASAETPATETPTDTEQQGEQSPELVTPDEHAEAAESLEPGEHVSDPDVPNDVEVAARSADMSEPSLEHEKTFVLGPSPLGGSANPYTGANGYDHEPNKAATRQYAIDAGLWPTGEVKHESTKRHPDGASWVLTYTVPVIPANDALDGAPTPRVVADDGDAEGATNYAEPSGSSDQSAD